MVSINKMMPPPPFFFCCFYKTCKKGRPIEPTYMTDKEKPLPETWKWKSDTSPLSNCRINVLQTPLGKHCPFGWFYELKGSRLSGPSGELWMIMKCWINGACCTSHVQLCLLWWSRKVYLLITTMHASLQWMNHTASQPASHHRVWCRPVRTLGQNSGFLLWISLREHRWIQHAHTIRPFCTCTIWTAQDKDFDLQELHLDVHLSPNYNFVLTELHELV